jgi:hypothetical protein
MFLYNIKDGHSNLIKNIYNIIVKLSDKNY